MREFFRRLLGVEALRAQIEMLKAELERMRSENERIQMKLSGLGKYEKVELKQTQAAQLLAVMDDFRKQNCKLVVLEE